MNEAKFSKEHITLNLNNDIATLGITQNALSALGHTVFINLEDAGTNLNIGDKFGDIEGVKTVIDLISPVEGVITELNEKLLQVPDQINTSEIYSWLVKIKVISVSSDLMSKDEYADYIKDQRVKN